MKLRFAKLLVIVAGLLVVSGFRAPLGAKSTNCRCFGNVEAFWDPIPFLPVSCGQVPFEDSVEEFTAGQCHVWCQNHAIALAEATCNEQTCDRGEFGLWFPTRWTANAQYEFTGVPYELEPVSIAGQQCN